MKIFFFIKLLSGVFLVSLLFFGGTSCTSHRTTSVSVWQDLGHSRDLAKKKGVKGSRKHYETKRKN